MDYGLRIKEKQENHNIPNTLDFWIVLTRFQAFGIIFASVNITVNKVLVTTENTNSAAGRISGKCHCKDTFDLFCHFRKTSWRVEEGRLQSCVLLTEFRWQIQNTRSSLETIFIVDSTPASYVCYRDKAQIQR